MHLNLLVYLNVDTQANIDIHFFILIIIPFLICISFCISINLVRVLHFFFCSILYLCKGLLAFCLDLLPCLVYTYSADSCDNSVSHSKLCVLCQQTCCIFLNNSCNIWVKTDAKVNISLNQLFVYRIFSSFSRGIISISLQIRERINKNVLYL